MNSHTRVLIRYAAAAAVLLSVFTWLTTSGHGQTVPEAVSLPVVVQLQHGRPFGGDVRRLPSSLPSQHEHRPDHGEDPMLRPVSFGDDAVQRGGAAAPAPSPGGGSGAGSFTGLSYALNGDGWPPDPNGDVGPTYYMQTVNTSLGVRNSLRSTWVDRLETRPSSLLPHALHPSPQPSCRTGSDLRR